MPKQQLLETRKIISLGTGSMGIVLPIYWLRDKKVKEGDRVQLKLNDCVVIELLR